MADRVTETKTLGVGIQYTPDSSTTATKTTYMKVPNPKQNLTESQIKTAVQNFISSGILGTSDGEPLTNTEIKTAYTEVISTREIDIGFFD